MSTEKNNPLLSEACAAAHTQFRDILNQMRATNHDSTEGLSVYQEIEDFLDPRLAKLEADMKKASGIEEQKELLLQLMRDSFNEEMMVSGRPEISHATNRFIKDMINAHTALVRGSGHGEFASKTAKIKDPGGTFQALNNYMGYLNMVSQNIDTSPAIELRHRYELPWGPVTQEQRAMLLRESETILRELGAPLITSEMPFQPDMLGVVIGLHMAPDHIAALMQQMGHGPLDENGAPPQATQQKWRQLQRDYPDMATRVTDVMAAAVATQGRGRADPLH